MTEKINEKNLIATLKEYDLPIVLYGMGNGADMIIDVLNENGLDFADVFASDGFVRGQLFHEKKVLTLSQVEEKYEEFVILMTFAVHDDATIEFVKRLKEKHPVFSPTVPVAGSGLFTNEFVKEHEEEFEKAYSLLADEKSKETFLNVLRFKISGNADYLFRSYCEKDEVYSNILHLSQNEEIVDLGAYDGDTIREFLAFTKGKYKSIDAFEPDEKNFKKLLSKTEEIENASFFNLGAWDKKETLFFEKKAGRNSRQSENGSFAVSFDSVDNVISHSVSFLKMDIEGAEMKALEGAKKTIAIFKPKLYVCAYHRNEDLFALPLKINSLCNEYKIYLRQHKYIPAWETNLYAVLEK